MATEQIKKQQDVRIDVRDHYGKIAADFQPGASSCCCGSSSASMGYVDHIYETPDVAALPEDVTGMSLGCGDPVTLAQLQPGQTVLDLGSGGGIDCFLAARQVGEAGHVIGVDMTPTMLEKARANQAKLGAANVEFRLGEIEHLPVADNTVDVIISNCVINLSPDKPQVFREAFRVLRPGGKMSVSDIMTDGPLPESLRSSVVSWASCVSGALTVDEYTQGLKDAGFTDIHIERAYLDPVVIGSSKEEAEAAGWPVKEGLLPVFSGKITARKPAG
jgi:SAM-dependent methyltransferase